ncbi:hypothetical protein D623_10031616 [Myotis brandtii]|uniref:Uncharacterized protein n=1 Tax=Myotis brandtii TaxID=109478 RepID=S7P158_MYOBR|nr:hypothetical protein D623_10031616 [Myotis brandtii]
MELRGAGGGEAPARPQNASGFGNGSCVDCSTSRSRQHQRRPSACAEMELTAPTGKQNRKPPSPMLSSLPPLLINYTPHYKKMIRL